jgi:hypothetical protein
VKRRDLLAAAGFLTRPLRAADAPFQFTDIAAKAGLTARLRR